MCDFSLERAESRPAIVGEKLVSTRFPHTFSRGFVSVDDAECRVAVCLAPGTELVFAANVSFVAWRAKYTLNQKLARFCQVNRDRPHVHHDALAFPDGRVELLTNLAEGQVATILQLPAIDLRLPMQPVDTIPRPSEASQTKSTSSFLARKSSTDL